MPSFLGWLDHDAEARDRSLRILAAFQEKRMPDELGLGAIRDAFADRLFPGTSTIQTRLRYMLIVPWVYRRLEEERVPAAEFPRKARKLEVQLIEILRAGTDNDGVLGKEAGSGLKRLPSMVYWSGLGSWGIRRVDWSQDEYHRRVSLLYPQRERRREDPDEGWSAPEAGAWHPALPSAPAGFPVGMGIRLTRADAQFLRDAVIHAHPGTLLAHLFRNPGDFECDEPWLHPDLGAFAASHRELLEQARRFSKVMQGAALLYNRALAEKAGRPDLADEHGASLARWRLLPEVQEARGWDLAGLWAAVRDQGHEITGATFRFVTDWVERVRQTGGDVVQDASSRHLVQMREEGVKGRERSRFRNQRALEQWRGYAGMVPLLYRWPTVRTYLRDLVAGLGRGD